MKGAIAAGHPATAEVGADVLRAGGNAVDACVAAGFASWVAESTLTGPGGGGFMLVHRARGRKARLLDFFVAVPSGPRGEVEEFTLTFDGTNTQMFRIGKATCAVPGSCAGLEAAHRAYGTLPWRDVVQPAIELARGGVDVNEGQALLHQILAVVLRETPVAGLAVGQRFVMDELAGTLERIATRGAEAVYRELAGAIADHVPAIRRRDLREYRVVWRRPVRVPYRGYEFVTNPPPSSGGVLIAYGLQLLERGLPVVDVMAEQQRARERRLTRKLVEIGGTTHISVVDAEGNAASLSASTGGGGSGVVVPGTGIHMNNMLGEYDLMVGAPRAGQRLTSMMAPSIALEDGEPRLVLGSAGSNRLRGAIMQVAVNVLARGMGVQEAIDAPRVHFEDGVVHAEPGADVRADVQWRERNLFFGGVSAVEVPFAAAGDPRRGGAGIVVE